MRSSIVSLPFLALYLVHAWLFTFDVLLLSRRRARTPVAVGTLCILVGTLIYVMVTCGNLPRLEVRMPDLDFRNLHFPGRRSTEEQAAPSALGASSGNFGSASCVSGSANVYLDQQQGRQQEPQGMCFPQKETVAAEVVSHIIGGQGEPELVQERERDPSREPVQQPQQHQRQNAAGNSQDSGGINFRYSSKPSDDETVTTAQWRQSCYLWMCCEGVNLTYTCFKYNATASYAKTKRNAALLT